MKHISRPNIPRFAFFILPILFLGFSLYWFATVFLPVVFLETQYQYRQVLLEVFHTTSLRGIFIPEFRVDLRGRAAQHNVNGIYIPKVQVDAEIIYNVDPNDQNAYTAALKKGIAHASGTALPDSGGLGYYFAHSTTPNLVAQYNAVFYLLGKLEKGDDVFVWHQGKRFMYKVTEKSLTDPSDVSFLQKTYEEETIVLQTCWPPGTTVKRMLVFAERVEE
ncbi:MAG: sortase [Candidatus Pacebacteria bacterium]|nr:sortase [Candidatus Paceibacterota bacterium]